MNININFEVRRLIQLLGASGLIVGGVSGVLRSTTPMLFALASGIQWFTLGSTFWGQHSPEVV